MEREVFDEVVGVLAATLNVEGRAGRWEPHTPLLGAVPEFDSMAVVSVLTALEEHYGFVVEDDDVEAATFETVGSLAAFVESKLGG